MRYLILILLAISISCSTLPTKNKPIVKPILSTTIDDSNNIQFFYKGKLVGEMTKDEFTAVVKGSENYNRELQAEISDPKRIRVTFLKKPWVIKKTEGIYKTQIRIDWYTKDNIVFKSLTIELDLTIDRVNSYPRWRTMYRDIAEIGLPSALVVLLIVLSFL